MAYPMIALTTAGTTFACAAVSLTETGLAVLDENGSRTGFVPYDSLEYVAPTEEASISDPPMRVLTEDGSSFGAASISQTGAGVAVLDASGARIGFVPYDTLTYVLPESKTGPTLPADATPVDGVNIEEEDDGGSPVWEDGDGEAESDDSDGDEGESDGAGDEESAEETGDAGETEEDSEGEEDSEAEESESEDETEEDDGPVWDDDPVAESDRDGEVDEGSSGESDNDTDNGQAGDDETAEDGERGEAENGEREEAKESELVVEWSFGDDE